MNKKFLALILMVSVATVGIFASNQIRVSRQDGSQLNSNSSPMYVLLEDGNYKNVETNQILSESELPEYCRLVDGDGQQLYQRNQNTSLNRNLSQNRTNSNSSSSKRGPSRNTNNNNSSRNFKNR